MKYGLSTLLFFIFIMLEVFNRTSGAHMKVRILDVSPRESRVDRLKDRRTERLNLMRDS